MPVAEIHADCHPSGWPGTLHLPYKSSDIRLHILLYDYCLTDSQVTNS
jgi:hypothetical protein